MNQIVKFFAALVVALAAVPSFAANPNKGVYSDDSTGMAQCLADAAAGNAKSYTPVTNSPFVDKTFTQKSVGKGGACLSGAYVHEDLSGGSPTGTVFVPEGFSYAEKVDNKGVTFYRMVKCSNHFRGIMLPTFAAAPATTSPVVVGTTTGGVSVSVTVNNSVTVNAGATAPAAASGTCDASAPTAGCHAEFLLRKREARTDGRCVVVFENDKKEVRYVRFDTMKDTLILHGARVVDVKADWVRTNDLVPIGRNGQAAKMSGAPACAQNYKALNELGVLDQVRARLQLTPTCVPKGIV